uniref:Uncharacterized protein n=1 Tax=viral metagenome TaxID=1070528 RepID=A0A6M3LI57_9ZZZZ
MAWDVDLEANKCCLCGRADYPLVDPRTLPRTTAPMGHAGIDGPWKGRAIKVQAPTALDG